MRLIMSVITLALGLVSSVAMAQEPVVGLQEGKEYQRAPKDVVDNATVQDFKRDAGNKVQVLEFFSYGCTWCFKLDPYVDAWQKTLPSYVSFQRVPVEFQPTWHTLSKAYYVAQDLKAMDKVHAPLFAAIHNNQVTDSSEETLRQFFTQHGVNTDEFTKAFSSFDVDRKQKWASAISQGFRITAVPAIVVQGPNGVFISTVRMAGSEENLLKVVDHLIKQEHAALTGAAPTVQSKQ